jgi:hypothetical protein
LHDVVRPLQIHSLVARHFPCKSVRTGAACVVTLDELEVTIAAIESPAVRMMVMVAATTAIRRSELRGLQWLMSILRVFVCSCAGACSARNKRR